MSDPRLGLGQHAVANWWGAAVHTGRVTSVQDPEHMGRVQVMLPAIDPGGDAKVWARVAVPFAGNSYGAFFLPDVDTEVLVAFVSGDAGWPVVIGNFWNGKDAPPEQFSGDAADRWTLTGKAGTRIAIVEQNAGQEEVEIEMPSGAVKAVLTDAGGGKITLKTSGHKISIAPGGVSIRTSANVTVNASAVSVSAASVSVDAGLSSFSGVVECDTLVTNTVVATTYTPGAGNVW